MRRTRWLIPPAIIAILVWVGITYLQRKADLASAAPPPPPRLGNGIEGQANDWFYTQYAGDLPRVTIRAKNFRQIQEPSVMELNGVELELYHANGQQFDLVKTASAQFDINGKTLFSDGRVDITMGVPVDGPPHGRMLRIHTSGVRFSSDTGKAVTDRAATFEFDQGGGSAVGAEYDPDTRLLHLASQVKLDWRGKNPSSPPMHLETGAAVYSERDAKVTMGPWSKLIRGTLQMDGGPAVVFLEENQIHKADVQFAQGVQNDPGRKVDFAADHMVLNFGDNMLIHDIEGERNTKLVSTSDTSRTTVTSDRINLDFTASGSESVLSNAVANGGSVAESAPVPPAGPVAVTDPVPPDTRTLRSDVIHLKMRAGGREIDAVETDGPGTLDFTPNRPGQPKRSLHGDRVWIAYGAGNRIQSFRSVNVTTRTDNPGPGRGPEARPPTLTASKDFTAAFDPVTSELTHIEQKTGFTYDEGDRHARGNVATLAQQTGVMTLDGAARVWDPTGATSADQIVMNQKTSEYTADGHVASTHVPDQNGKSSAMLSNQEVLEARAQHMVSTNNNRKIHYEGNAVAWQGANRVEADKLDIDREKRVLEAHGKVVSQFADKAKGDKSGEAKAGQSKGASAPASAAKSNAPKSSTAATVFTVVHASDLIYTEETRLAYYRGGVAMVRPDLAVNSTELRAFLKDSSSDSSLDKAFADGTVKFVSTAATNGAKRTRIGTSEHGEYYVEDQRVVLVEGQPLVIDSLKGRTTGKQLTWFANNDRLLVDGVDSKPAETTLHKKK
jgi:lipopolysaccharide export system protein LptA